MRDFRSSHDATLVAADASLVLVDAAAPARAPVPVPAPAPEEDIILWNDGAVRFGSWNAWEDAAAFVVVVVVVVVDVVDVVDVVANPNALSATAINASMPNLIAYRQRGR